MKKNLYHFCIPYGYNTPVFKFVLLFISLLLLNFDRLVNARGLDEYIIIGSCFSGLESF